MNKNTVGRPPVLALRSLRKELIRLQLPSQVRNLTSEQPLSSENEDEEEAITPPADERDDVGEVEGAHADQ
jgi:hypothetical protein